jgi:hypothetical protein
MIQRTQRGDILVLTLLLSTMFFLAVVPFLDTVIKAVFVSQTRINREEALQIAEAGINYYQWHLAHYPTDYMDGSTTTGPYVHQYIDYDTQDPLGQYSLQITPPPTGSTIVTITSTGSTYDSPGVKRTITAKYGVPSLALFSYLSNDVIWIGSNETVNGQMQSNNQIHFDGNGNAPIMSSKATSTCPSSLGSPCPSVQNGVFGSASQSVKNFWQFPVPAVDFSALTANLANLKSSAQSAGIYLSPSNAQGYSLVFNSNGTVSIYKVTSLKSNTTGWDVNNVAHNEYTDYRNRSLQSTVSVPNNGVIYIEDNVWVEGTVAGKVMVAAAILPYNVTTAPTIYIPNNITYLAKDGNNVLGLLAQNNIVVTNHAPLNLEIDAAMVAQNGSVEFFYYPNNVKTSIFVFGSIMTYGQWTWTWVDGSNNVISGYASTNNTYDGNLLYGPPPSFPLSNAGYKQLSWQVIN